MPSDRLHDKGLITLPVELRRCYRIEPGDVHTLADLGDGALLLTAGASKVSAHGDRIARLMAEQGVTLEDILAKLDLQARVDECIAMRSHEERVEKPARESSCPSWIP